MKKLFLALSICFLAFATMAQVSFGPKIGMTISKYGFSYKDSGLEPDVKYKMGGSIGVMMNLKINSILSFQPALSFTKKGSAYDLGKLEVDESIITGYQRTRVAYIEVPLNIAAGIKLGSGQIQLFAGPYLAYAVCGKQKWDYEENVNGIRTDYKDSQKINLQNTDPNDDHELYQRPFDWGIDFGIGYHYNQLLFNIGFAMGMANLQPDLNEEGYDPKDEKYSNRTIFLSAAWLFGGE